MMSKVEIDGKWYELVPLEEVEKKESSTYPVFYYGCDSECGIFSFNILLNDDEIWGGTQSVTYYPEGYKDKNKSELWDNTSFLVDVLEDNENDEVTNLRKEIGDAKFINLINILQQVRKKGWI